METTIYLVDPEQDIGDALGTLLAPYGIGIRFAGDVESLVCYPANMTHAALDDAAQRTAGIGPGLLRLSVGIEHKRDLVEDLCAALDRVQAWRRGATPLSA